jgi:Saxitoxin biosynthesis operon protein SxtJ
MISSGRTASRPAVVGSSDRTFGLVFAGFFCLIALWPAVSGRQLRWWAFALAVIFLAATFLAPRLLTPLNRIWFRLGLVLHHVVNPVVMALVYYSAVVPMGLLMRARGKDLLRLKRDPALESYWIVRDPPGPPPGSMSRQF